MFLFACLSKLFFMILDLSHSAPDSAVFRSFPTSEESRNCKPVAEKAERSDSNNHTCSMGNRPNMELRITQSS
jgi:hypothetical protein